MSRPAYIEDLQTAEWLRGISVFEAWEVGLLTTNEAYWLGALSLVEALKSKRALEYLMGQHPILAIAANANNDR